MQTLEIYSSRQGEGIWTGQESVFVRFLGCHLHCRFCDTAHARSTGDGAETGVELDPEEIAGRVLLYSTAHVVLTGGEPMLSPKIVELTTLLKEQHCQITIETSGTIFQPVVCDLMSISPKLSNTTPRDGELSIIRAHDCNRWKPEIMQQLVLEYNHQLKFVVDADDDLLEVEEYLTHLSGIVPSRVMLMPQAPDVETMMQKAAWIEPYCQTKGYRYCPRMQLVWYGNKRRT